MNYEKALEFADKALAINDKLVDWVGFYNDPDMNTLGKLANILDTTVDYLTGNTDNPDPKSSNLSSSDLAEMLDNVRSYDGKPFDDHDKELLTTFLKGLYADK